MLKVNCADLLLYPEEGIEKLLNEDTFSKIYVAGHLGSLTSHSYLHKKHKALLPFLEAIL